MGEVTDGVCGKGPADYFGPVACEADAQGADQTFPTNSIRPFQINIEEIKACMRPVIIIPRVP